MDKLKNIDWKQFGINHGEKIGISVISLLAVYALMSTSWSTFKKTDTELKNKAEATHIAMDSSEFPEDKASGKPHGMWEFMDIDDIEDRASRMGKAVGFDKYAFTTPLSWPLVPPQKKRSGLSLVRPEEVVVAYFADSFAMKPKEEAVSTTESTGGKATDDASSSKDTFDGGGFRTPGKRAGNALPGGGPGGGLSGSSGGLGEDSGGQGNAPGGSQLGGSGTGGGGSGGLGEDSGGGGLGEGSGSGLGLGTGGSNAKLPADFSAEGHRVVSIRAIVDVYGQLEQLSRSLHVPMSDPMVRQSLMYLDYHIQRQEAQPGDDPWSGDWEDVDTRVAVNIIRSADGRDEEVVSRDVTDPAMTMPLPPRLVRSWGKEASHPRIENYEFSASQIERQRLKDELVRKYYDEFMKKQKQKASQERATPGGWHQQSVDLADMEGKVQSDKKTYEDFKREYKKALEAAGIKDVENPSASGNLLLFRYLDFAVEQGKTYRYRVQLELENPHYGVPLDELEDHGLGERVTLKTDWSDPSIQITVPYDYEYFVNDISESADSEEAEVNMFYWNRETGTKVAADDDINRGLKVGVGDFIGGKKRTYLLRMDDETLNQEEVVFESRDVLAGVSAPPKLDAEVFTDLSDAISALGRRQQLIGGRMTVIRPDGDIVTVSSSQSGNDLQNNRAYMKGMYAHFEGLGWKDTDKDEGGSVGGNSKARRERRRRRSSPSDPGSGGGDAGGYPGAGSGYPGADDNGPPPGSESGPPGGYPGAGEGGGPPPGTDGKPPGYPG